MTLIDYPTDMNRLRALRERIDRDLDRLPGHDRRYRVTQLCNRAITALRDLEDYARLHGGDEMPPRAPDELLATRARRLYERIRVDILEGTTSKPTVEERVLDSEPITREQIDEINRILTMPIRVSRMSLDDGLDECGCGLWICPECRPENFTEEAIAEYKARRESSPMGGHRDG